MALTDSARHDLVAFAVDVDFASDLDVAWAAYSAARTLFYGLADDVQIDDGVRTAWSQVLAAMSLASDRFATPIVPLVVFA